MPIRCNNGRGIQINQQACSIDISYCGCSTSEIKSSSLFLLPHNSFFFIDSSRYHKHAYALGEHYNSVVPAPEEDS